VNTPQVFSSSASLALLFLAKREVDPSAALVLADQLAHQVIETPPPLIILSWQAELERILPLPFAAELQSTSVDTLLRQDQRRVMDGEASQIINLSSRRRGMRLKHALLMPEGTAAG
jgi:hypothetical protein